MTRLTREQQALSAAVSRWLATYSVSLLRISLGLVFLVFGVLKFFPGVSPAEGLAEQTMSALTFGLVPGSVGIYLVATMETAIGICLTTGKQMRLGLALLAMAMVGVLSPMVLFYGRLFPVAWYQPTLEGQYVIKDIVLLAAGLVIAGSVLGNRTLPRDDDDAPREQQPSERVIARTPQASGRLQPTRARTIVVPNPRLRVRLEERAGFGQSQSLP